MGTVAELRERIHILENDSAQLRIKIQNFEARLLGVPPATTVSSTTTRKQQRLTHHVPQIEFDDGSMAMASPCSSSSLLSVVLSFEDIPPVWYSDHVFSPLTVYAKNKQNGLGVSIPKVEFYSESRLITPVLFLTKTFLSHR
jgi:hypothetical protein